MSYDSEYTRFPCCVFHICLGTTTNTVCQWCNISCLWMGRLFGVNNFLVTKLEGGETGGGGRKCPRNFNPGFCDFLGSRDFSGQA